VGNGGSPIRCGDGEGKGDMKYDPQKHHRRSIRLNEYDYSQAGAYFVTIVTQQRVCLFGEIVDGQMLLNAAGRIVQWEWRRLGQRFPNLQLGPFVVMPNHLHGIIVIRADGVGATRRGQNGVGVVATRQGQNGYSSGMEISPDEASIGNGGSPQRNGNDRSGRGDPTGAEWYSSGMHNLPGEASIGNGGSPLRDGKDISPDEAPVGNGGSPLRDGNDGSPVPNGPGPGSLGAVIGQLKSRVTKRIRSHPGMSGISVWQRNYYEHIIRNADDYYRVQGYIVSNSVDWSDDDENLVRLRLGCDSLARQVSGRGFNSAVSLAICATA